MLDVYAGELAGRPPRPELAGLPQILLTPHISGGGEADMAGPVRQLFAGNLRRYLDGQPLLNVAGRCRGYLQGACGFGGGLRRQGRQFLVKELAGRPEHGGCGWVQW